MIVADLNVSDTSIARVLLKVVSQGGRLSKCGNGHFKVIPPDRTKMIVFMSSTPSDFRSIRNIIGKLRRAGFTI